MVIDASIIGLVIVVLLALLGLAVGYGGLRQQVKNHGDDIKELKTSYKNIDEKLNSICNDVAGILATLKEQARREKENQGGYHG